MSCSSIICYAIFIKASIEILKNKSVIVVYALIKILSIFLVAILGYIFVGEKLDIQSKIGILLGVISIYLLYNKTNVKNK
jgi:drug/metabolite transporter (DMT)-like permease